MGVDDYGFRNLFIQDAFGTYDLGSSVRIRVTPRSRGAPVRNGIETLSLWPAHPPTHNASARAGCDGIRPRNLTIHVGAVAVQDRWRVTPRVTLNHGLCVDAPIFNKRTALQSAVSRLRDEDEPAAA